MNRQCTEADDKNLHQTTSKHPCSNKIHSNSNKTSAADWLNKVPLFQKCARGKNTNNKPCRIKHVGYKQYCKHKQQVFRKYEQRLSLPQPLSLKEERRKRNGAIISTLSVERCEHNSTQQLYSCRRAHAYDPYRNCSLCRQ